MKQMDDLVSAADIQVKVGSESQDIPRLSLEGINTRLTATEARQSDQGLLHHRVNLNVVSALKV
jgi:hypothetical protein